MDERFLPASPQKILIPPLPASGYYIPNFITESEEAYLLQKIDSAPLPTWKNLSHRRLQAHPSPLSPTNTLLASVLPTWLSEPIIPRLLSLPVNSSESVFHTSPHGAPNHCLINEYLPGQGIHAHEDGDAYHPVVATVSLGSHIVLDIKSKVNNTLGENIGRAQGWRVLQEPRSLLITTGKLYTDCLHGISELTIDENLGQDNIANWDLLGDQTPFAGGQAARERRISLTFRDVVKVKRLSKAFGGLKG